MAKNSAAQSKTAAILDYLAKNRKASAKQVVDALAEQSIDVSTGLVYNVKSGSNVKKKKKKKKPGRKKAAKKSVVAAKEGAGRKKATRRKVKRPRVSGLSADDLVEAKKLVKKLGSLDTARKAIRILEELQ